jgi:anti-sigma B factor antagonist
MEVKIGMDGDVVVMNIAGDLVASSAEDLKAQVAKLVAKNFTFILLDLSNVGFMDSSGLGACMAVYKLLKEHDGMLVCARPSDTVAKVFKVTRADTKLKVVPSKNDGVAMLARAKAEGRTA